jgi:hypothetical protein
MELMLQSWLIYSMSMRKKVGHTDLVSVEAVK